MAKVAAVNAKAAVVNTRLEGQDPPVHLLIRTVTDYGLPGSLTGAQFDEVLASWVERGYEIKHINTEMESVAGAVPQFKAVILCILVKK